MKKTNQNISSKHTSIAAHAHSRHIKLMFQYRLICVAAETNIICCLCGSVRSHYVGFQKLTILEGFLEARPSLSGDIVKILAQ